MARSPGARRPGLRRHESTLRERFERINGERLRRIRVGLGRGREGFLDLLPLLLHCNHPLLPGYVGRDAPAGIADFRPCAAALAAARRLARSFAPGRSVLARAPILGVYFIGSSGSIAHSEESDFDVWICHRPDLSATALEGLRTKVQALEGWAHGLGIEMHGFVFDAGVFRRGEPLPLSRESSGTTQLYLLLDEFYRSGIRVAGLGPLWWEVPVEADDDHDGHVARMTARGELRPARHLDFGPLDRIPPGEFFGAAVWQLCKGIGSPYKSVLKLLLLELYAGGNRERELLSQRYKRAVQAGETGEEVLDPYLLLYRTLEEHLRAARDEARLGSLRRAFYLKVGEALSRPVAFGSGWRRERMASLVAEWGWNAAEIARLDAREGWRIDEILEERGRLVATLTASYRALSRFARDLPEDARISQADLNVLGRRLYAAFERRPGKVEQFTRGIAPGSSEAVLRLLPTSGNGGEDWLLYPGSPAPGGPWPPRSLRRSGPVIELLAWCHFNRIADSRTRFLVGDDDPALDPRQVEGLAATLAREFPLEALGDASVADLARAPRILRAALFVNVGVEPLGHHARQGLHLASSRSNALSYGGLRENLALRFDLVLANSWGEVYCFGYREIEGLMECLCELLRRRPAGGEALLPVAVACPTPGYGAAIRRRIEALVRHLGECLLGAGAGTGRRYLVEASESWHLLELIDGAPARQVLRDRAELARALARCGPGFVPTHLDPQTLRDTPLPWIYARNRPGIIELYVLPEDSGDRARIYVLDEQGALFEEESAHCPDVERLAGRFAELFGAMRARRMCHGEAHATSPVELAVEYHRLERLPGGAYRAVPIAPDPGESGYLDVQVIGSRDAGGSRHYTLYCRDQEFSSREPGGDPFTAAARYVLGLRRGGELYPIFITDLELAESTLETGAPAAIPTSRRLEHKRIVEGLLNRALTALAQPPGPPASVTATSA